MEIVSIVKLEEASIMVSKSVEHMEVVKVSVSNMQPLRWLHRWVRNKFIHNKDKNLRKRLGL